MRQRMVDYIRAHARSALVLLVIVVWAHFWRFETAAGLFLAMWFMLSPATAAISGVTLLICTVALLERTEAARVRFRGAAYAFAWCVILTLGVRHGEQSAERGLERGFAPVIVALEVYRREHGSYPTSLASLSQVQPPLIGSHRVGFYSRFAPGPRVKTEFYCITFNTIVFLKHSYCSNKPRWRDWD